MDDNNVNKQTTEQTATPVAPQPESSHTGSKTTDSNEILYSVLSYIGFLSLIVLYVIKPKTELALFHAKQGANLFIIDLIVAFGGGVIKGVLNSMHVPVFGSVIGLVSTAIWILNIIGLIYAAQGKKYELPVISQIKIIK